MFKCLQNLEEDSKSSPVLSEIYESVHLVGSSVFDLFLNNSAKYLIIDSFAVQRIEDLLKRKIIKRRVPLGD